MLCLAFSRSPTLPALRFLVKLQFTQEEVAHWLLPRPRVVYSYVVEDSSGRKLTDLISFYLLPSSVINNTKNPTLFAAYSFYNVPGAHTITTLMQNALIMAKLEGIDVFNCLDVMENKAFLSDLHFGPGDGHLQYYLYNWRCPEMEPSKLGVVLL